MPTVSFAISGMSCGHCLASVKRAIESVPGASIRELKLGAATVEAADDTMFDAVRAAIEDQGYSAHLQPR